MKTETLNLPQCSESQSSEANITKIWKHVDIKALELPVSFRIDLTGKVKEYQHLKQMYPKISRTQSHHQTAISTECVKMKENIPCKFSLHLWTGLNQPQYMSDLYQSAYGGSVLHSKTLSVPWVLPEPPGR